MNEMKVSRKSNREREKERAEVRVFLSELKRGGNGGERKKKFLIQEKFFLFPGKLEWRLERVEKGIQGSIVVFTLMAFW